MQMCGDNSADLIGRRPAATTNEIKDRLDAINRWRRGAKTREPKKEEEGKRGRVGGGGEGGVNVCERI